MTDALFDRIAWDRGVHLRGTPVWFDAARAKAFCVLTDPPAKKPPNHKRVFSTPSIAEVLQTVGIKNVVPIPTDRSIALGDISMRAFEPAPFAGGVLLQSGATRFLFLGAFADSAAWPQVDHAVLHLPAFSHRGGTLARTVQNIVGIAKAAKGTIAIAVDAVAVAHAIAIELEDRGFSVAWSGWLARLFSKSASDPSVVLHLLRDRAPAATRHVWIDSGVFTNVRRKAPDATFRLIWFANATNIKRFLKTTKARSLSIVSAPPETHREIASAVAPTPVSFLSRAQQLAFF